MNNNSIISTIMISLVLGIAFTGMAHADQTFEQQTFIEIEIGEDNPGGLISIQNCQTDDFAHDENGRPLYDENGRLIITKCVDQDLEPITIGVVTSNYIKSYMDSIIHNQLSFLQSLRSVITKGFPPR
ncbi:MAG: hypothetical protein ABIA21_03905 [Candidatus Aenigmatarchaeota archaeon]